MPRAAVLPLLAASFASFASFATKGLVGAGRVPGLALTVPAAAQTHACAPRAVSELRDFPSVTDYDVKCR